MFQVLHGAVYSIWGVMWIITYSTQIYRVTYIVNHPAKFFDRAPYGPYVCPLL